jgi:hypothetical protein
VIETIEIPCCHFDDSFFIDCRWIPTIEVDGADGVVFGNDHFGYGLSDSKRRSNSMELCQTEIDSLIHRASILFPEISVLLLRSFYGWFCCSLLWNERFFCLAFI